MNATELYLSTGKSAGIFFCEKCRNVAHDYARAEQCCQNYKCPICGADTGGQVWLVCDKCREAARTDRDCQRFDRADKLTEWDGWVFLEGIGNNGFSESVSDFINQWQGEHDEGEPLPKYVWACKKNHFAKAHLEDFLTGILDEAYEGFEPDTFKGLAELKAAIERFNQANADVCAYEPDYSNAVLIQHHE